MLRIHKAIQAGNYPNASFLARELEVSSKSIHRDLAFMRDRLQLPLEYDPKKFGFFYTQQVSAFPTLQLTEGELFALLVAEKALQQYRGTSFEQPLLSAFRKMADSLPETISVSLADWEQTISFRTSAEPIVDLQMFDQLARAVARCEQLEVSYRKAGQQAIEQRRIDPYHLANINGEWFLFAYDHLRRDIRTFVPSRIRGLRPTGVLFVRPADFSVERTLRGSFNVHSGGGRHEVVICFDSFAAGYVREKRWHASQRLRDLSGGRVELRLRLSSLSEIERWILSWGGHARVVRPPELVESVWAAARRILHEP